MKEFEKMWAPIASFLGAVFLIQQLVQAFTGNRNLTTGVLVLLSATALSVGIWKYAFERAEIKEFHKYSYHWFAKIILLASSVIALIAANYILASLNVMADCCSLISTQPLNLSPTPFPRGNLFLNIDFNEKSDGFCNDYDLNILGYESHQYYIQPLSPAGFISHCQSGLWDSIGSLEVEVYPTGDKAIFGYAVLFGWKGNETGSKTTDMCIFGIKRDYKVINNDDGSEYLPYTQVMIHQRIDGKTIYPDNVQYLDYVIDDKPHVIRMVMLNQNTMLGYLDNVLIANYSFRQCGEGGIGLIAWGTGNTKVYFDNLKLYGLP